MEEKDRKCPRGKLHCFNWMEDIPGGVTDFDIVEVQFKNTRKGFYRNSANIDRHRRHRGRRIGSRP